MTRREKIGFLIAILILAAGSVLGFTLVQKNFDDHERLDHHACKLANINRSLIAHALDTIASDPGTTDQVTRDKLVAEAQQIKDLEANCDDS